MLPAARAKVVAAVCHDRIVEQLQTDAALIVVGDRPRRRLGGRRQHGVAAPPTRGPPLAGQVCAGKLYRVDAGKHVAESSRCKKILTNSGTREGFQLVGVHRGHVMPGPSKWNGAKRRLRRPQTEELKKSLQQNKGKLPRQRVSRPEDENGRMERPKPTIKKARPLQDSEKRLRSLNKLLRQIEQLQEREMSGETLDAQQREKVSRLDETLEEMGELMGGGCGGG